MKSKFWISIFTFYWIKVKFSFLFSMAFENGFHFYSFLRFKFFFDFIFFHFYKNELFIFEFFHTFLRTLPGSRLAAYRGLTQQCQWSQRMSTNRSQLRQETEETSGSCSLLRTSEEKQCFLYDTSCISVSILNKVFLVWSTWSE